MGHSESRPERDIHSPTGLPQETRKSSKKQSNFTLKVTRKRTAKKAQSEQRKEIIKFTAEINKTETKKKISHDQ